MRVYNGRARKFRSACPTSMMRAQQGASSAFWVLWPTKKYEHSMSKICTSKLGRLQGQGCIQDPPAASTPPHISQPRFDHRSCSRDILGAVQEHKTDHVGCLACGTLTTAATVLILLAMGRRPVLRVCLPRAATDFSHISSQHVTRTRP